MSGLGNMSSDTYSRGGGAPVEDPERAISQSFLPTPSQLFQQLFVEGTKEEIAVEIRDLERRLSEGGSLGAARLT